jgi:hypothetical protein
MSGPVTSDGWVFPRVDWAAAMPGKPEPFGWPQGLAVKWAGGRLEAETHSRPPNRWVWSGALPGKCRRMNPGPPALRSRGSPRSSGIHSPRRQSRCPSQSCNQQCFYPDYCGGLYIEPVDRLIVGQRIGDDVEGSGRGINKVLTRILPGGTGENKILSHVSRYPYRDANQTPMWSKYKSFTSRLACSVWGVL